MKKYESPAIVIADQLAEGVYMLSGDQPVELQEALDAANGEEEIENTVAADLTSGLEASVGGDQNLTGNVEGNSTEVASNVTAEINGTDVSAQTAYTPAVASAEETGEVQSSLLINCDSKYMNGVWQAPSAGPWGDVKRGCQEVLGCHGCPANKSDGCALQDPGTGNTFFRMIGTLMPEWEASGKMPTDSPYGV